ncbi:MAG: hypothetical protein ABIK32_04710 [Chloroflexota bacterium]|nr:hypothetical protein [Chloroflexota bacterium]
MNNIVSGILGNTLRRYLVIALVASLAITGGMFAYAFTTKTTTITATSGGADYAVIGPNTTDPCGYTVFGKYRGSIPEGYLYSINVTSGYPGDLAVNVYLNNIDQLGKNYGLWMMRLDLVQPSDNASMDIEGGVKVLSMQNGVVSFVSNNMTAGSEYRIRSDGGVYKSFSWGYWPGGTAISPSLTAEVLQAQ